MMGEGGTEESEKIIVKFRKKPVVIEALKIVYAANGECSGPFASISEIPDWVKAACDAGALTLSTKGARDYAQLMRDCRDALARVSQPQPEPTRVSCPLCDGDGFAGDGGNCSRCGGSGKVPQPKPDVPPPDPQLDTEIRFALKQVDMTMFREENCYRPGIARPTAEEWKERVRWLYGVLLKVVAQHAEAARVSVPTEPPQKECFCNHETRRPDGLSQRDSGNGPASSAGGDIAGLNAGQRASIPVDGAIPSESLPLQDPPSTIGPPWWCATCDSWRHTMPCGRDECPHPSNSLQEKRHMEIPSEANVPPNIVDAAEMLWVVLANVSGGDWTQQTPEWQEVAARWRDYYFKAVDPERPESPLAVGVAPPPQEQPEVNDSLATIEVNDLTHDDACLLSRIFNADSDLVQIDQYGRINDFLKRTIETTGTAKDRDRCVCPDCGQGFAFDFKLKRVTCGCPASPRRSPTRSRNEAHS